jgi:hypothetical protein
MGTTVGVRRRVGPLLAAALIAVTACAKQTLPQQEDPVALKRQEPVSAVPVYDGKLFAIDPASGEKAIFGNIDKVDIREAVFNKRFNHSHLEALLHASAFSTVDYARELGIWLYRTPRHPSDQRPIFFVMLDTPPTELDDLWNTNAGGVSSGSILVGLYLDACVQFGLPCRLNQVVRPLVIVQDSGDRWTLVHEIMHHLFNLQRKTDGKPGYVELEGTSDRAWAEYLRLKDVYSVDSSQATLLSLAQSLHAFAKALNQLQIVSQLEEAAVEYTLIQEYSEGHLQYVPSTAAINAQWYMNRNRTKALSTMHEVDPHLASVKKEASGKGWTDVVQEIEAVENFEADVTRATDDMIKDSERRTHTGSHDLAGRTHVACEYEHSLDNWVAKIHQAPKIQRHGF